MGCVGYVVCGVGGMYVGCVGYVVWVVCVWSVWCVWGVCVGGVCVWVVNTLLSLTVVLFAHFV